jgi:tetratricopeptide (TPR) repeat protein
MLYFWQGAYWKAEPILVHDLAIMEKSFGPNHPNTINSLSNLAGLYQLQGAYEKAEPLYLRAVAIREKAIGPDHPDLASSLNDLGSSEEIVGGLRFGQLAK